MRAWTLLLLCLACTTTSLAQEDTRIEEARRALKARKQERSAAEAAVSRAEREHTRAKEAFRTARRESFAADLRIETLRDIGDYASRAVWRLTDDAETTRALRARLEALPEGAAERQDLETQIEVYERLIDKNAKKAMRESNERVAELDAAVERAKNAKSAMEAARKERDVKSATLAQTREQMSAAEAELVAARATFDELSAAVAPPFLEKVEITQGGDTVYSARWELDSSYSDILSGQIDELKAEIQSLEGRLPEIAEEQKRHKELIWMYDGELLKLQEQVADNEMANAISSALHRGGALLLTVGDVLKVGVALQAAMRAGMTGARALGQHALTTVAENSIAKKVATAQVWRQIGIRGVFSKEVRATAKEMIKHQARRLADRKVWRRAGIAYELNKLKGRAKTIASGKQYKIPSVESLHRALASAEEEIEQFVEQRDELDIMRTARSAIELHLGAKINTAYQEQLNKIHDIDGGFWRTVRIGKLSQPDTAIGIAEASAGIAYYRSLSNLSMDLYAFAQDEENRIDELVASKRKQIEELLARRAHAPARSLIVSDDRELRVGEDETVTVSLFFSTPLENAPTTVLGRGVIARTNSGGGLPLPGPDQGAVLIPMSGNDGKWTGSCRTGALAKFLAEPGGIPLRVQGQDLAGKNLDADPGSRAALVDGFWEHWDEFRSDVGSGRGGMDTWHVLNLRAAQGTSYCFVLDASGSMKTNNRLEAVKKSAADFLAHLDPGDEVSLWVFYGCDDIRLEQDFTLEVDRVADAIVDVQPAKLTPLALAIRTCGNHLLDHGRYAKKALVIMTDGIESCDGGDPASAAAAFREQARIIRYIGKSGR